MRGIPRKLPILIPMLIILGLFLVACGGSAHQNSSTDLPDVSDRNKVGDSPSSALTQSLATVLADPDPTYQVISPNVDVATDPEPTQELFVKTEFSATDPASLSLASGIPQLVEFFAFW